MSVVLDVVEFLRKSEVLPVIDVRSPAEFEYAHIPGALNLPIFNNEERAEVGTIYKQKGKIKAVKRGLEIVGPKMAGFVDFALKLRSEEILVHCWRGGMRSSSMAWLFETVGLRCYTLEGGYKSYRNHVLESFKGPYNILLLGGFTGSGKTEILKMLSGAGEQVIDLEGLAHHKGSAFGSLGEEPQPTSEHFENILNRHLREIDPSRPLWLEDESRNIGRVFIPPLIWEQMRRSPMIQIDMPAEVRVGRLVKDYGKYSVEELVVSIKKIEKRLGYDNCKRAIEECIAGNFDEAARLSLIYYDKIYGWQISERFADRKEELIKYHLDRDLSENISKDIIGELLRLSSILKITGDERDDK